MALGLVEQVTHAAGTDTHKHFYKFRTRNGEKRNTSFTRNCFCQKRFACTWRAHQKDALRNASAKLDKLLRLLQEFDNFRQLLLGFLHAGHILERNSRMLAAEHTGARFPKGHGSIVTALSLSENKPQHTCHKQNRQDIKCAADHSGPL